MLHIPPVIGSDSTRDLSKWFVCLPVDTMPAAELLAIYFLLLMTMCILEGLHVFDFDSIRLGAVTSCTIQYAMKAGRLTSISQNRARTNMNMFPMCLAMK